MQRGGGGAQVRRLEKDNQSLRQVLAAQRRKRGEGGEGEGLEGQAGGASVLARHGGDDGGAVAQQEAAGLKPDMIRVSIGIEHIDDILGDFDQSLEKSAIV